MKKRIGFVSNSSSSSFIISHEKKETLRGKITLELDSMKDTTIETIEELQDFFMDEYGFSSCETFEELYKELIEEDDWYKNKYERMESEINNGRAVSVFTVSNEDYDGYSEALYNNGVDDLELEGTAKIIESER